MSSSVSSTATGSTGAALITSTGVGSGLNIDAIVSELTTAEGSAQQTQITNQQTSLNSQISAFGTFSSALATLQATLSTLEVPSELAGFSATVADPTIATVTADSTAVAGTYSLAVQNLASSAVLTSAPVLSAASTAIGTGTLNIAVGSSSESITIDSSNNTLSGIAGAINSAANNPGVTASIITTKDGARLVLSGTTTGAANAITTTETDGGTGLSSLVYDPTNGVTNLKDTTPAADANFTINGYAATSGSNVATGVLSGVSINLLQASATTASVGPPPVITSTPTTLTIAPNTANAATSIGTFVTALNGVLTAIQSLTGYDATTQTAGALNGNATLQSFQNQLESILGTVTTSGSGTHSLSDLGYLEDATTGTFTTNSTTLTNALTSNLASVQKLLGGSSGIATQIGTLINGYTGPAGLLTTVTQGLQTGLKTAANQQTALTAQLAIYSATLTKQYNAMDAAVAALKQTETYLTAEFNANATSSSSNSSLSSGTTST